MRSRRERNGVKEGKRHSVSIHYILGTVNYHLSHLQQFSEGGTDVVTILQMWKQVHRGKMSANSK